MSSRSCIKATVYVLSLRACSLARCSNLCFIQHSTIIRKYRCYVQATSVLAFYLFSQHSFNNTHSHFPSFESFQMIIHSKPLVHVFNVYVQHSRIRWPMKKYDHSWLNPQIECAEGSAVYVGWHKIVDLIKEYSRFVIDGYYFSFHWLSSSSARSLIQCTCCTLGTHRTSRHAWV